MNIIIDLEFKDLIPPLAPEEYSGLEENILAEGCRDALVLWGDVLVDGHNRYEICKKHDLPFKTVQAEFGSRNEAVEWIIRNQFGRRNLSAYDRSRLALRLKPVIAEKAKEHQGERTDICQNSDKSTIDTKKVIAKAAGVSHDTIAKVEKIESKATPEVKQQLRNGDISINQAYQSIKREEKKQEVQQRIEEHAAVQTGIVDIQDTDRKYNIIYADPPWQYWEGGNKNQSLHYTTRFDKDLIVDVIPGCANVVKTKPNVDKLGVDYIAVLKDGSEVTIDAKTRRPGSSKFWKSGEPELCLERYSVVEQKKIGWLFKSSTIHPDYILYTFDRNDTDKFYLIPYLLLRKAAWKYWRSWATRYGVKQQPNDSYGGYTSDAVFVPASMVISAVSEQMVGIV